MGYGCGRCLYGSGGGFRRLCRLCVRESQKLVEFFLGETLQDGDAAVVLLDLGDGRACEVVGYGQHLGQELAVGLEVLFFELERMGREVFFLLFGKLAVRYGVQSNFHGYKFIIIDGVLFVKGEFCRGLFPGYAVEYDMKTGWFLDFDNVFFRTDDFFSATVAELDHLLPPRAFHDAYEEYKQLHGYVHLKNVWLLLEKQFGVTEAQLSAPFLSMVNDRRFMVPEARDMLLLARMSGTPVMISEGYDLLQRAKMQAAGVFDILKPEEVHITEESKLPVIEREVRRFMKEGGEFIFALDDRPKPLLAAQLAAPGSVCAIRIREGKYKTEMRPHEVAGPWHEFAGLAPAYDYLRGFPRIERQISPVLLPPGSRR